MELPMKMPDLATTDSDIKLIRWLVQPGQPVQRGQPLCEIETDKATSEVESIATGLLKEVRALPDELVAVGQVIAIFEVAQSPEAAQRIEATPAPGAKPPTPTFDKKASPTGGMFARNRAAAAQRATGAAPGAALSPAQRTAGQRM